MNPSAFAYAIVFLLALKGLVRCSTELELLAFLFLFSPMENFVFYCNYCGGVFFADSGLLFITGDEVNPSTTTCNIIYRLLGLI